MRCCFKIVLYFFCAFACSIGHTNYTPNDLNHARQLARTLKKQTDGMNLPSILGVLNAYFARTYRYESPLPIKPSTGKWPRPSEFFSKGAGDCKGFAVAKFAVLVNMGVSPHRMRLLLVQLNGSELAAKPNHMVLAFDPEDGGAPYILDNLISSVRRLDKRPDLSLQKKISLTSWGWKVEGQGEMLALTTVETR